MLNNIFEGLIYIFAVYGAVTIIFNFINFVIRYRSVENKGVKLVLIVKNQEKTIEGIIRNIYSKDTTGRMMCSERVTVLDMNSADQTLEILKKLEQDYEHLDVLTENERDKIFEGFVQDEPVSSKDNKLKTV